MTKLLKNWDYTARKRRRMYNLEISSSAIRFLKKLSNSNNDLQKINAKIRSLQLNPLPFGSVKLTASVGNYYRVRVGAYRIVYKIKAEQLIIMIVTIGNRKDIYRNL